MTRNTECTLKLSGRYSLGSSLGSNRSQCFSTAGPRPGTGPWHQL